MKQLLLQPATICKAQKYSGEIFSVKVDQSWEGIAIHGAPDNEATFGWDWLWLMHDFTVLLATDLQLITNH